MSGRGGGGDEGRRPTSLHRLLDRMSHQLKNPLQAIVVNAEVVRLRADREAPELWASLERHATAIDDNVHLLNRRIQLLVLLARAEGEEPISVDPARLAVDLVGAAHLDGDLAPVRVEPPDGSHRARARPGHLLELLFAILEPLSSGHPGEGEVRVDVGRVEGSVRLALARSPPPPRPPFPGEEWDELVELARRAGGEAHRAGPEGKAVQLLFPAV